MALRTSLIIDLAGNIQSRARQYGSALGGLARRGCQAMQGLSRACQVAGAGLDKLGNRYTALLGGGAAALAVKGSMDLQERLTRLGITADVSDDQIRKLHERVLDIANDPNIRVDPSQILSGMESVMEKTGDLKFVEENIRNIGLAIQGAGAEGGAVGDIFAEFQKQGMSARDALASVDILIAQGKAGAFTLKDLARLGPRVVTAYTSLGRTGPQAMREMGAVLQMIRMATGSSEEASTAWEAMLRTFSDRKKLEFLQKQGVKVFDPEELKKGREVLRPANELIEDILKAAGNSRVNLSDVFDATAMRAFNALMDKAGVDKLRELMALTADGTTVQRDSARAAQTANSALQSLRNTWGRFADANLAEPIQKLADALNAIDPERLQTALRAAGMVAAGLGGAVAVKKAVGAGQAVRGWFSGGTKAGAGAAIQGAAGLAGIKLPLPVYVVNRQMSLTRDAMQGKSGAPGARQPGGVPAPGAKPGRGARAARGAGAAAGLGAAGYAAWDAYQVLKDDQASLGEKAGAIAEAGSEAAGGFAGGVLGAKVGAAIGTAIVPGLGTAIGGALGGVVGGIAGSKLGQSIGEAARSWFSGIGDWFTGKPSTEEAVERAAQQIREAANLFQQTCARGVGVDVNVQGNATASIARGSGEVNLSAGVSHSRMIGG